MNYQKHLTYWFIACISIFFLFSCAKDGEPGPQGEQGEKGDQGEQGDQGEKGEPGTANVAYSDWLESPFEQTGSYSGYPLVEIDTNEYSLNSSVFLVFAKTSTGIIYTLPVDVNFGSNTSTYSYITQASEFIPPRILLERRGLSPAEAGFIWATPSHFRYVIIPGGVNIGGRLAQFDFSDYEQVSEFYNIPN